MSRRKRKRPNARSAVKPTPSRQRSSSALRNAFIVLLIVGTAVGLTFTVAYLIPFDEQDEPPRNIAQNPNVPASVLEDDPSKDGWDSEVLSNLAAAQLKKLAKSLVSDRGKVDGIGNMMAPAFSGSPLRPHSRQRVFNDQGLDVVRLAKASAAEATDKSSPNLQTKEWLDSAVEFSALFAGATETSLEIKVFRIAKQLGGFSTHARFQASAVRNDTRVQVQAIWQCRWTLNDDRAPPKISMFQVVEYEEVEQKDSPLPLFSDCTQSAMHGNQSYETQFHVSFDAWGKRLPNVFDHRFIYEHGIAVGDVNGDGRDDIYVCEPGALPNRLFVQNDDLTVKDASAKSRADWLDHSRSALLLDLDNDGDQDLAVAITGMVLLMANNGQGIFTLKSTIPAIPAGHAMAAADYDLDGLLDIYVCSNFPESAQAEKYQAPFPYHDATNGGRNVFLRNLGNWRFVDVTDQVGLDDANDRWSFAAAWEDFDNDGDMDLYVANDFGRNCLYENEKGRFKNVAAKAGVEDVGSGMSVAWGDYNRDGLMDLYVSNMYSTAGSRITFQQKFKPNVAKSQKALLQRMAKGNTLFTNLGKGKFQDDSRKASVAMARWAWGAPFVDLNNDGWEDLIVGNGYITRDDSRDL